MRTRRRSLSGSVGPVVPGTVPVVGVVSVEELVKRYPKSQGNAVDGVSFDVATRRGLRAARPERRREDDDRRRPRPAFDPPPGRRPSQASTSCGDPVRARSSLAVIPQRSNLDRSLSIRDNLVFHAAYHGVPAARRNRRADELLEQFGLFDRARSKPDLFSGGQAQRVMIARALMHAPRVLFLDEPTTGLDPAARLFVWDRLRELRDRGVTLVLTTHDMDEAAELADRVGIMDHGKLLALDTPETLMRSVPRRDDARGDDAARRPRYRKEGDRHARRSHSPRGRTGS